MSAIADVYDGAEALAVTPCDGVGDADFLYLGGLSEEEEAGKVGLKRGDEVDSVAAVGILPAEGTFITLEGSNIFS